MYTLNPYIFGGDDFNVYAEHETHGCAVPPDNPVFANLRLSTAGFRERLDMCRQLIAESG